MTEAKSSRSLARTDCEHDGHYDCGLLQIGNPGEAQRNPVTFAMGRTPDIGRHAIDRPQIKSVANPQTEFTNNTAISGGP